MRLVGSLLYALVWVAVVLIALCVLSTVFVVLPLLLLLVLV